MKCCRVRGKAGYFWPPEFHAVVGRRVGNQHRAGQRPADGGPGKVAGVRVPPEDARPGQQVHGAEERLRLEAAHEADDRDREAGERVDERPGDAGGPDGRDLQEAKNRQMQCYTRNSIGGF